MLLKSNAYIYFSKPQGIQSTVIEHNATSQKSSYTYTYLSIYIYR